MSWTFRKKCIGYIISAGSGQLYLGRPSLAAILFVDWLVGIVKVENFVGNDSDTLFYSISFKKYKKGRPPASFSKKKCLRNILLIFFGLRDGLLYPGGWRAFF